MSAALACDLCGALYRHALGTVRIETIYVGIESEEGEVETSQSWSEIDFCPGCSAKLFALIRPSMVGLETVLAGKPGAPE